MLKFSDSRDGTSFWDVGTSRGVQGWNGAKAVSHIEEKKPDFFPEPLIRDPSDGR